MLLGRQLEALSWRALGFRVGLGQDRSLGIGGQREHTSGTAVEGA